MEWADKMFDNALWKGITQIVNLEWRNADIIQLKCFLGQDRDGVKLRRAILIPLSHHEYIKTPHMKAE